MKRTEKAQLRQCYDSLVAVTNSVQKSGDMLAPLSYENPYISVASINLTFALQFLSMSVYNLGHALDDAKRV